MCECVGVGGDKNNHKSIFRQQMDWKIGDGPRLTSASFKLDGPNERNCITNLGGVPNTICVVPTV